MRGVSQRSESSLDDIAMPADHTVERRLLGAALLRPASLAVATSLCRSQDFDFAPHRALFEAMVSMAQAGEQVDQITVCAVLEARGQLALLGGYIGVDEIATDGIAATLVEDYARRLASLGVKRTVCRAGIKIARNATRADLDTAAICERSMNLLYKATEPISAGSLVTLGEAVDSSLKNAQRPAQSGVQALSSGLRHVDRLMHGGGFIPKRMYVLAARPGVGKTALAMQIACTVGASGRMVIVFSMEMSKEELADRTVCNLGRIDSNRYASNRMTPAENDRATEAAALAFNLPVVIDDSPAQTLVEIRTKCQMLKRSGLALVVLDYLQKITIPGVTDEYVAATAASKGIKRLAQDLDLPFLAIASMNRDLDKRPGKKSRPQLSDLRASGQIESDADMVAFLYRDELVNDDSPDAGVAEFIVRKQRGPMGTAKLHFDGPCMRFSDLQQDPDRDWQETSSDAD